MCVFGFFVLVFCSTVMTISADSIEINGKYDLTLEQQIAGATESKKIHLLMFISPGQDTRSYEVLLTSTDSNKQNHEHKLSFQYQYFEINDSNDAKETRGLFRINKKVADNNVPEDSDFESLFKVIKLILFSGFLPVDFQIHEDTANCLLIALDPPECIPTSSKVVRGANSILLTRKGILGAIVGAGPEGGRDYYKYNIGITYNINTSSMEGVKRFVLHSVYGEVEVRESQKMPNGIFKFSLKREDTLNSIPQVPK